jgi:hypothetical protein
LDRVLLNRRFFECSDVLNDFFKYFQAKRLSCLPENSHLIVQGSFEEPAKEIKINFNFTIILFLLTLKYNFSSEIQTITNVWWLLFHYFESKTKSKSKWLWEIPEKIWKEETDKKFNLRKQWKRCSFIILSDWRLVKISLLNK